MQNGEAETAEVIIVGAGPAGLMLAGELRLRGIDVLVLERSEQPSLESKAANMHARTVELLEQRGIASRFLELGHPGPYAHYAGIPLGLEALPTRHAYVLGIAQSRVVALLEDRARELGARICRPMKVVNLHQHRTGVEVEVETGRDTRRLVSHYLVGSDGSRSVVRMLSGIGFPGTGPTLSALHGDVELTRPPPERIFGAKGRTDAGTFIVAEIEPGIHRVMAIEFDQVADRSARPTLEALRAACNRVAGTDFGMRTARWVGRFSDATRQAEHYRRGRVMLAGDAAHIHFPSGGHGLNLAIHDAVNLGWKLAAVLRDQVSHDLLDTYHDERAPAAERVMKHTRAQTALSRPGVQADALREVFSELIGSAEVNLSLGAFTTQLDVRYSTEDREPLVGCRIPDQEIETDSGRVRLFSLLQTARPRLDRL